MPQGDRFQGGRKTLSPEEIANRRETFLDVLRNTCHQKLAMARSIGETEPRHLGWFDNERERDPKFASEWDSIMLRCYLEKRLPRGSHWTPPNEDVRRKTVFLEQFKKHCHVHLAVSEAGGDISWYYKEVETDKEFAALWEEARKDCEKRVNVDKERVRYFIRLRGLNLQQAADSSFISKSQLQAVLGGNAGVSIDSIGHIAKTLEVEPWMLLQDAIPPKRVDVALPDWRSGFHTGVGREESIDPRPFYVTSHAIRQNEQRTGVHHASPKPITNSLLNPNAPEWTLDEARRQGYSPDAKHDGQVYIPDLSHSGTWAVDDKERPKARVAKTYLEQRRNPSQNKGGISTGTVIAIGVGILVLIGLVGTEKKQQ